MQYAIYCWKIKALSSYLTPWQSDTIYGHIFWAISLLEGEEELKKIIREFEEKNPPFIVSNGFTENSYPLLQKESIERNFTLECQKKFKKSMVDTVRTLKKIHKISFVSLDDFNVLRGKMKNSDFIQEKLWLQVEQEEKKKQKKRELESITYHNVINRTSGSTEDNALFTQKEYTLSENLCIFIKLREDFPIDRINKYLHWIEETGYGKKISTGKGQISRVSFEKFEGFQKIENANAFVVLSNYIPEEGDYEREEHLEVLTKIPKLASDYTKNTIPFKKTFSCFTPGSLFYGQKREIVGKVLKDIHVDKNIIQVGIPFTLEVELPCQK
ncbi:hypothetical protein MWG03_00560 [Fusobacterium necrophorum]|uniref:type III-A CRISPR-associated RAMP protein Csm4 n=1 Tax=Fusobacterium necrophorum TaxID=859 RepID=UPI000435C6FF|nr:hypothetical protein [Fusobacterium necrophorum]EYD68940.1 hypothetical protein FNF_07536 [Fusobacterium necrophorum subsp. funduliforme B35]MDK4500818.1 hypothetical protein [Fusobacterium necrophorum]